MRKSHTFNGIDICLCYAITCKAFSSNLFTISCWDLPWNNAAWNSFQPCMSFIPYALVFGLHWTPMEVEVWVIFYSSMRVKDLSFFSPGQGLSIWDGHFCNFLWIWRGPRNNLLHVAPKVFGPYLDQSKYFWSPKPQIDCPFPGTNDSSLTKNEDFYLLDIISS